MWKSNKKSFTSNDGMSIMFDENDNSLCEICISNWSDLDELWHKHYYIFNTHCIDLRRNREARENKNYQPTNTVF